MKLSEARKIIGLMAQWYFYHMAVLPQNKKPEEISKDISLADMLKANKMLDTANKRKRSTKGYRRISVTLDDRAISAIYTALHYDANSESIICVNDKYLFIQ